MALIYEKEGRTVIITLNRPEALNAFDPEQAQEFSDALIRFRDDADAWVAIVTGAGDRAFSAGADLRKLLPKLTDKTYQMPPSNMRGLDLWKPLIAAVNGIAYGGGLELVLACDLRIAAENASFGQPEVWWSLMPGWGGTQRLPRMVPWCKAAEILLMGATFDAQEAYRIGLVNAVVPREKLMSTAKEWANKVCQNGPLGVWAAKEAMIRGYDAPLPSALRLEGLLLDWLMGTEDVQNGLKAFAEKRKPEFKAR